jgi:hypothetical protein
MLRLYSLELKQRHYDVRESVHPTAVWTNDSKSQLKYRDRHSRFKCKKLWTFIFGISPPKVWFWDKQGQSRSSGGLFPVQPKGYIFSTLKVLYDGRWLCFWFIWIGATFLFKALIYIRVPHSSTTQTGIKGVEECLLYSLRLKVFPFVWNRENFYASEQNSQFQIVNTLSYIQDDII